MNENDRELLPPPADCLACNHLERRVAANQVRCACLKGHPMHPGCGWFDLRREGLIARDGVGVTR